MQFNDVIGQNAVKKQLAEMVHQNRLSHALLFLGKEGTGALPMALAFARFIQCITETTSKQDPTLSKGGFSSNLFGEEEATTISTIKPPTSPLKQLTDSCGHCAACQRAKQLIHPDIHFSYPVIPRKPGDKPKSTDYITEWREFIQQYPYGNIYDWLQFIGAENKQGNITAAECSDIIHKLSLKSYEGSYKILVLWMPEYLEKEGNKLLKLIEEPPANTLFLLVAENESQILPTIVSRCQLVKFPPLDNPSLINALVEKARLSEDQAQQVAAVCDGNYHEALQLLQHSEEDWQSVLREWLNAILKTGPVAQVKWVEETSKMGREKQKQFLRYFNHLLEQAIRLRLLGDAASGSNFVIAANELDFAQRLNKIAEIAQQQAIIEELDKASYYIERNANAKMLFQALTIKLYHIIADKSLILMS